ncbi:hypothetical protein [Candidatus Methylacidiphilum infernorum]|uniref:FecR protein domain-containing protein n=1 Tax=Methylacidiphilum infernorum (isolate V4) TaxID=481448 RepID=B3E0L1_METI4|nr:hypothetical protein [Candidatus Methylacidiphilum infernorum]ACD82765.1 Hypothetical protein Minf_0710 [Methylacidiphilum infernorum V4]
MKRISFLKKVFLLFCFVPLASYAAQITSIRGGDQNSVVTTYGIPVQEGSTIKVGQVIKTDYFSVCTIGWKDRGEEATVDSLSIVTLKNENPVVFELARGKIEFSSKDFQVITKGGTFTSQTSGKFFAAYSSSEQQYGAEQGDATLVLTPKNETYQLHSGEMVYVRADGTAEKRPITQDKNQDKK